MFAVFLILVSIAAAVQGRTECYENECFSNDYPYSYDHRPRTDFPQTPDSINTKFLLFTRRNPDHYQVIRARNLSTLNESYYDGKKPTVLIVHGYLERGNTSWPVEMCRRLLLHKDINCISVDWSGGSFANYTQAVNNVQVVGSEIARFINKTMEMYNTSLSNIHIIAHSVGAQAAGEAGKRRPGIRRITLLDPACPLFEGTPKEVRIDPTDAECVIAIHTNAGFIGMKQPVGHVDFYPNGGVHMPGCPAQAFFAIFNPVDPKAASGGSGFCDHSYSYQMYLDIILNPAGFMGYCAPDYSSFQAGAGFPCPNNSCSVMGDSSDPCSSSCKSYYLNTGPRPDSARWRYNVTVHTTGNMTDYGTIGVALCNQSACSDTYTIYSAYITANSTYYALIDASVPPPLNEARFVWNTTLPSPVSPTLGASPVTAQCGNDGSVYKFCSNQMPEQGNPQTLQLCPNPSHHNVIRKNQ